MQDSKRGFSLTELVVVVAILMLLAAAILPIIGPLRKRSKLKAASGAVAGVLRSARSMAIAHSTVYSVEFETASETDRAVVYSGTGSKLNPDGSEELPQGTSIYSCSPVPPIRFDPDGTCRATHSVTVLGADAGKHVVKVGAASGQVKIIRSVK